MRILCDVDGVVADLMGGFCGYVSARTCLPSISKEQITHHKLGKSPSLGVLGVEYYDAFRDFMASDPYGWVDPMPDSTVVIRSLVDNGYEFLFVTATMSQVPESYPSKANWLKDQWLGDIPILSVPSHMKHLIRGDLAIDDRLDICLDYMMYGTTPLLFIQPWSVSDVHRGWLSEVSGVFDRENADLAYAAWSVTDPEDESAWRSIGRYLAG